MPEKFKAEISEILDRKLGYWKQPDGSFSYEICADYRDEMDSETAIKILCSDEPMEMFCETMAEWYDDYERSLRADLEKEVMAELTAEDGPYPMGLSAEKIEMFHDLMLNLVCYQLPEKHYLEQTFYVDIMVDTGDGNYDFVLNGVYPAWYGQYGARIDDKAGIVWLAKTQGYTKTQLWNALRKGDLRNPKGFLESMRVELANLSSHMSTVTFLVEMTLEDLISLNRLIRLQDRNGHFYDTRKNPYCGYIILDKNTETGLFDPWGGSGSCFEIELEKDVKLPVKYIRSALPDGGDGYSVGSIYGMCGSAWKHGGIKLIHAPGKIPA